MSDGEEGVPGPAAPPQRHSRGQRHSDKLIDAVVVGAGLSGLFAAHCLHKEGLDVVILEATDRVGGRTLTETELATQIVDLGGAYLGREQTKLIRLAQQLGLEFYHARSGDKDLLYFRGQRFLHDANSSPTSSPLVKMDFNHAMKTLDRMSKKVPLREPWECSHAAQWDAKSLKSYIEGMCWTEMTRAILNALFQSFFGTPTENVSLLFVLHMLHCCGGVKAMLGSKSGLQEMRIKGGTNIISQLLAEPLKELLEFNSPVISIHHGAQGVVIKTKNNKEYKALHVVVAVSPLVLKSVTFTPELPPPLQAYVDNEKCSPRTMKTVSYYSKAYWREHGFSGSLVSEEGIVLVATEDTQHNGEHPAIMGIVTEEEYTQLSREDRKLRIAHHYADAFDLPEMRGPCDYIEKDWHDPATTQFTGASMYSLPPNFLTTHRRLWGDAVNRVHFAGTEASIPFRGYMEGAIRAGEKAAKEIFDAMNIPVEADLEPEDIDVPYMKFSIKEKLLPGVKFFLILAGGLLLAIVIIIIVAIVVKSQEKPSPSAASQT